MNFKKIILSLLVMSTAVMFTSCGGKKISIRPHCKSK